MTTDRELLELAAKAAGIEGDYMRYWGDSGINTGDPDNGLWNPLEDDGHALRLACKLKLNIAQGDFSASVSDEDEIDDAAFVRSDEERTAVVRRLIVRAAAAMAAPPAVGAA